MKITGKLKMNFGPVGHRVPVDNFSRTTIKIDGAEPFMADSDGTDCFDQVGYWITPQFAVGQAFSISIPSGIFLGKITSVALRMEDQVREHEAMEMQVVTVAGQWDGKQGGINSYADGGLCGLGRFFLSEVTSAEGTFGKAQSIDEYNARANRYRSLHVRSGERNGAVWYSLTPKGNAHLRRYLNQFTLDMDSVAGNSPYDWGDTPIQFALAKVRWEKEFNGFAGDGLEGWANLSFGDVPCQGVTVSFRHFRQWLDMQFPNLNDQIRRQQTRAKLNPTERNIRRLARYQATFTP